MLERDWPPAKVCPATHRLPKDRAMKKIFCMLFFVAATTLFAIGGAAALAGEWPPSDQNLKLSAPSRNWDEAIPLGNGLTGGLLWGDKATLRLSLDRGDLWDERTNGPKEWWKTQTWKKGGNMWEDAYHGATPTKLPAGAIELTLPDGITVQSFELNKATAEAIAHLSGGRAACGRSSAPSSPSPSCASPARSPTRSRC